jgi:hypothetical protein
MVYKSYDLMSLFLKSVKDNTYCIMDGQKPMEWVVYGFIRFYKDDLNTIRILLGLRYNLILRKLSYDDMHTVLERVTDKVIRYMEDVRFCVAALEN